MSTPATSTESRPLRRDAERNRRLVLDAARELFTARGLGVSLDEIARHAGVGVATAYRRFPDKEQLIDALFEERIDAMAAIAEEALRHPDPWEAVVLFFERGLELQAADAGLKEVLLCTGRGSDRVRSARERMSPLATRLFERAQRAGVLREDVEPQDTPILHLMVGAVIDAARDLDPELWRRFLWIVLDGLRPTAAGTPPLPVPALGQEALETVMRSARSGRR